MINLNNFNLTEGQVLIAMDEAETVVKAQSKKVELTPATIVNERMNQILRTGTIVKMSNDVVIMSTTADRFKFLAEDVKVVFSINFVDPVDLHIVKIENGEPINLTPLVYINPNNIIGYITREED